MEDAQRAARPSSFKLTPEDLINLVEKYRQRQYNEDVEYLDHELGGIIGLQEKLKTSIERGLTPIDFQEREEHFGSNFKAPSKRTPFCRLFFGALEDFMLRLLLVCAVISISIDMGFADEHERSHAWIEGFAIFVAVFVVAMVGSWNDYKKEEQFLKLQAISEADNKVVCLRDGREEVVHYNNIVVGDVVKIKAGMNIPVDGIVLKASGIQCNEAAMTGESDDLRKDTLDACKLRQEEKDAENAYHKDPKKNPHDIPSPVLLSGTQFATGEGWFLVIVVGKHSCVGKIMAKLEQRVETTPLQEKLEAIGTDIGKIGMYCALLTIHILFLRFFIEKLATRSFDFFGGENPEHPHGEIMKYCQEWLSYFIIGVTIVVVAVPEGLPLAVMISLAYSVKKMLLDKNFVKRLASCEIMGGANNICSDKTGTLTTNVMTVTNVWAGRELTIQRGELEDNLSFKDYFSNDRHTSLFTQAMTCNTVGSLEEASATEKAMLKIMARFGVDLEKKRKEFLPDDYTRFHFTSKRKRMSTILENNGPTEHGYDRRVHLKGAAEIVLACCSHYLNQEGEKVELQDEMKSNLLQIITDYAQQALRTICFAYKDLKQGDGGPTHEDMDEDGYLHVIEKRGFTLISIIGIKDIIRLEVPKAVKTCQKAGITVRMVTGDNKITAMAIAKECNIINEQTGFDQDSVMEGPEFYERMGGLICKTCKGSVPCDCDPKKVDEGVRNLAAFRQIWKSLRVLARSRPEDKYLLVTGLKEMGDIVAVTGDGTNDAPALKKADVGFAMGITGTDVAKHACDIIVMDDNFASIVKACMWGRSIYENIRKFLLFQLQVNIVALVTAFIGSVVLKDSPLEPIQLLWVNLIMDSLGALALATEPPRKELLKRPPYRRDEYIVSRKMVKHLLGNAVYQIAVVYAIVFGGENWFPEPVKEFENPNSPGHVFPGRPYDWDQTPLYALKEPIWGPSRQFTNVFNVFVWMQIFNMLNARKINDEKWIFAGILDNWMYVIIWFIIVAGQIIIVLFGGIAMNCAKDPSIHGIHWAIAIAFGVGQLFWDFGLRFIPDTMCPEFGKKQKNPLEDEQHSVFIIRKKRTQSFSLRQPASVNKEGSGRQASLH